MAKPKKRLKAVRVQQGLTQVKLGKLVGTSKQNIWNIENLVNGGSVRLWDRLEAALNIPQQELRKLESDSE
jgi:DNA-binding XRE family transcriptional regulator